MTIGRTVVGPDASVVLWRRLSLGVEEGFGDAVGDDV